jgi:hypothetical protein
MMVQQDIRHGKMTPFANELALLLCRHQYLTDELADRFANVAR